MTLIRGALRKIVLRPATRITMVVLVLLVLLVYLGLAVAMRPFAEGQAEIQDVFGFPDAYGMLAALLLTFGGIAAAAWAGAIAAGEWTWNTFRSAVARGASRPAYVLVTLATASLLVFGGWIVLYAVGVVAALVGGAILGIEAEPLNGAGSIPVLVLAGWWAVSMEATIGFTVAFVTRSQVAGIVAVVALYFGEQFASIVVPADVMRFAPITAANTLVSGSAGVLDVELLVPLAVTTVYLVLAATVVALVARRTEIA
jgi:hypothetical protein